LKSCYFLPSFFIVPIKSCIMTLRDTKIYLFALLVIFICCEPKLNLRFRRFGRIVRYLDFAKFPISHLRYIFDIVAISRWRKCDIDMRFRDIDTVMRYRYCDMDMRYLAMRYAIYCISKCDISQCDMRHIEMRYRKVHLAQPYVSTLYYPRQKKNVTSFLVEIKYSVCGQPGWNNHTRFGFTYTLPPNINSI